MKVTHVQGETQCSTMCWSVFFRLMDKHRASALKVNTTRQIIELFCYIMSSIIYELSMIYYSLMMDALSRDDRSLFFALVSEASFL